MRRDDRMKTESQKDSAAASLEEQDNTFQESYDIFEEDQDEFYDRLLEEDSAAEEDYFEVPEEEDSALENPEEDEIFSLDADIAVDSEEQETLPELEEEESPAVLEEDPEVSDILALISDETESENESEELQPEELLPEELISATESKLQSEDRNDAEELEETMNSQAEDDKKESLDINDEMAEQDIQKLLGEVFSEGATESLEESFSETEEEDIFSINDFMTGEEASGEEDHTQADIFDEQQEEDSDLLGLTPDSEEEIPKKKQKKEKKRGFFSRIFGNIKEERSEEEIQKLKEKVYADAEAKEKAEKEKQQKEAAIKAAKEAKKKKDAEDKKKKAAEAKKAKAEKAKAKKAEDAAKKEEKIKKQQEIQSLIDEIESNEGKINKIGAGIVFTVFAALAIVIVVGTNSYTYKTNIQNAEQHFEYKHYNQAYDSIAGMKVKEQDQELYDKIMTVMYVNKQLNSYHNYYKLEQYPEALDSLIKGLKRYEKYISIAISYGIEDDLEYVRSQLLKELNDVFHVSEKEAYILLSEGESAEYGSEIYAYIDKRFVPPVKEEPDTQDEGQEGNKEE